MQFLPVSRRKSCPTAIAAGSEGAMEDQHREDPERSQEGGALGLPVSSSHLYGLGGSVRASSDGPGKGSEFTVRLPLAVDATNAGARAEGHGEDPRRPTAVRILVVDDNVDAADSLAMLLRMMGSEVRIAYEGVGALRAAEEFRPEVALVDIGLPGMNGHEVAQAIRGTPWGSDVLLIATTGWSQPEDRDRSKQAGFDHHLVKPVDLAVLVRLLASVDPAGGRAGGATTAAG